MKSSPVGVLKKHPKLIALFNSHLMKYLFSCFFNDGLVLISPIFSSDISGTFPTKCVKLFPASDT